jgi:hypothetical protein
MIGSCSSPCSFAVSAGGTYQVVADSFGSETSSHLTDGATGQDTVTIQGTGATTVSLVAEYDTMVAAR